ncbi:hypothetical protein [Methylorubrum sp. SB2]|uniref:hypothetical protein n=1 Tax=Methylorubrum subtropicum TaxID=3138812 RepID=UPI00313AF8C9
MIDADAELRKRSFAKISAKGLLVDCRMIPPGSTARRHCEAKLTQSRARRFLKARERADDAIT